MTLRRRLRFEQPPARSVRSPKKTKHEHIAQSLVKHATEWACIGTYSTVQSANSIAYQIRNGKIQAYAPAGSYEATARSDGKKVWARYVGQDGGQR
jgi:hypothetical protein